MLNYLPVTCYNNSIHQHVTKGLLMIAMETGLKIFEKPEFGSVRVVEKDGDPWFVARDVCEALGFDEYNTNNATKGLDDDEKSTILKVLGRNDSNGLT